MNLARFELVECKNNLIRFVRSLSKCVGSTLQSRDKRLRTRGPVSLRINGNLEITEALYLGYQYGISTAAPTFVTVSEHRLFEVQGTVYFYGGNIIRVEHNAVFTVGDKTRINIGTRVNVKQKVQIGGGGVISANVHIRDNDGHKLGKAEGISPVYIGNKVWIGYGAIILKGVSIGDGSVIGAGSVVTSDCPAKSIIAGNPARIIRSDVEWQE